MNAAQIVVALDPLDPKLGVNALGELVRVSFIHTEPVATARAIDNGSGWLHFVKIEA